ncbi:MAG: TrbG/VirB9 family P-type conjugative transfer protein [Pseudomonadota bacterium]|nr:TrbG/VirB9 family P-type conjugative transfer protein [Pseudomonadota bacterium]
MNLFLWILLVAFPVASFASQRVRHVVVQKDQIITVRTAIGIATIIQVPDRPNSVVVGDQNAFKVEYLDQAITIKPLHGGAKSNLYVYTDWRRYNVQLITGSEPSADYVVYLDGQKEKPKEIKSTVHWMNISKEINDGSLTLKLKRISKSKDLLTADFEFQSSARDKIDPSWIWITQSGKTKPIHNLIFSSFEVKATQNVKVLMQILRSDLDESISFKIELRRKKTTYLTLPKVSSWK